MRLLIYSDVHGNLPAFEKVLKDVGLCDGYICLGDLVNYGPWSNECVDLALSLSNSIILMGNHEKAFIDGFYVGENRLVNDFFEHTIIDFNRFDTIKSFLSSYRINDYLCKHTILDKNIYQDTFLYLDDNFIIGHSHHQFCIQNNGFKLYNSGSIGQNRGFINVANYLIYDSDTNVLDMKFSKFDISYVIKEMEKKNYPENCILYYKQKKIL